MKKVKLGKSGLTVSEICLGTMDMGTLVSRERSYEVLDTYYEMGGNFIDTANVYAWWNPGGKGGESEALISDWMRARKNRANIVIATKVGGGAPGTHYGLDAKHIVTECEASLKRLCVDVVDLYYAHLDDCATPLEETMDTFDSLVRQGKVRAIAASNFTLWRLDRAIQLSRARGRKEYCCLQQRFSYLRIMTGTAFLPQRPITDDIVEYADAEQFPLLAYTPLLGGCYVRDDRKLPPQYASPDSDKRLAAVRALAKELGVSANQVVLAWLLQNTPKILPVVASGNATHLRENLSATDIILTVEQLAMLNQAGACNEKRLILIGPDNGGKFN